MNRKRTRFLSALSLVLVLFACGISRAEARPVPLAKAGNVMIERDGPWVRLRVRNPVPGASGDNIYILVPRDIPLPPDLPPGRVIRGCASRAFVRISKLSTGRQFASTSMPVLAPSPTLTA